MKILTDRIEETYIKHFFVIYKTFIFCNIFIWTILFKVEIMKRIENQEEIREALSLDQDKCVVFPLTENILRIFFDEEIQEHEIERLKQKMRHCCEVALFNSHTVDIIKKHE